MTARLVTIGWREWAALPDLGLSRVEAKIDTGARTSALHALAIEPFRREGVEWVRFTVPLELDPAVSRSGLEARVQDRRAVRNTSGNSELRFVIVTRLVVGSTAVSIELTLADRTRMRYPLLIGRTALAGRFVVDPAQLHLAGTPR